MKKEYSPWTGEEVQVEAITFSPEQMEEAHAQLSGYRAPRSRIAYQERHAGVYSKYDEKRISKQGMLKIFRRFATYEAADYFQEHTIRPEDILRIGIDKFVVANGWTRRTEVRAWRNYKVRLHVCPSCEDQFVPALMQQNHGLCRHCRKEFSNLAIRSYVTRNLEERETDEVETDQPSFLINFYALFTHDRAFRNMFRVDALFAQEEEERYRVREQEEKLRLQEEEAKRLAMEEVDPVEPDETSPESP